MREFGPVALAYGSTAVTAPRGSVARVALRDPVKVRHRPLRKSRERLDVLLE
jgi:hypothetical protein